MFTNCFLFIICARINIGSIVQELKEHAYEWKKRLAEKLLDLTRASMFDIRKKMKVFNVFLSTKTNYSSFKS